MGVVVAVALVAAGAAAQRPAAATPDSLLTNGGFELGAANVVTSREPIWPHALLKQAPRFTHSTERPHAGKACAQLTVTEAGGYCSFTQMVQAVRRDARSAHAEGWIDFTPDARVPGTPSVLVNFFDPERSGDPGFIEEAKLPAGAKGWTRVSIDVAIPAGATRCCLRCGMVGCGTARFDDVILTVDSRVTDAVKLFRAHGDYTLAETRPGIADPWIDFPMPFPFERQTPLAMKVTTDPPDRVASVEITKSRQNRTLRVHLKAGGTGDQTAIHFQSLAMVSEPAAGTARSAGRSTSPPISTTRRGANRATSSTLTSAGRARRALVPPSWSPSVSLPSRRPAGMPSWNGRASRAEHPRFDWCPRR